MPSSAKLRLNGDKPSAGEIRRLTKALVDPNRLQSAGGFLFKSRWDGETLHLGIVPSIAEGERLHHYDIVIPEGEHIIGSVSANGEFTLLFKADVESLDAESRSRWRNQFLRLAEVLLNAGYAGEGKLDWITTQIIKESVIFPGIPATLTEIVISGSNGDS